MKRYSFITLFSALFFLVACSDVGFQSKPSELCLNTDGCRQNPNGDLVFDQSFKTGKVDILFVVDNSGSMYSEQEEMANRFPGLTNAIDDLDWQVAVTTTDISGPGNPADAQNGNGAFQDGKLVKFSNGSKFIKRSTPNAQSIIENNIKRAETLNCDNGGSCPSGDERGTYAAYLAVTQANARGNKGSNKFFRPGSHLAVVILSDENVRSSGGTKGELEAEDYPSTLVSSLSSGLGTDKIMSVHSIIVNSSSCNTQQNYETDPVNTWLHFDRRGYIYKELSYPNSQLKGMGNIVRGTVGDICASNYTYQMGDIGASIQQNVNQIQLACNPYDFPGYDLSVNVNGTPLNTNSYYIDADNRLIFTPAIGPGQQVNLSYACPPGTGQ